MKNIHTMSLALMLVVALCRGTLSQEVQQLPPVCAVPFADMRSPLDECRIEHRLPSDASLKMKCQEMESFVDCAFYKAKALMAPDDMCSREGFIHALTRCRQDYLPQGDFGSLQLSLCAAYHKEAELHPCMDLDCPSPLECAEIMDPLEPDTKFAKCYVPQACPPIEKSDKCEKYSRDHVTGCELSECMCESMNCSLTCFEGFQRDKRGCRQCACADNIMQYSCEEKACTRQCDYYTKDALGCEKCECQCEPSCCVEKCEFGYVMGKHGCPTCECVSEDPAKDPSNPFEPFPSPAQPEVSSTTTEAPSRDTSQSTVSEKMSESPSPATSRAVSEKTSEAPGGALERPVCVSCAMFCEYGQQLGEDGCPLCQCNPSPCQAHVCAADERCVVQRVHCLVEPCPPLAACLPAPSNVELKCPVLPADFIGACMQECDAEDTESCPPGLMCCSNGCGHSCITPDSISDIENRGTDTTAKPDETSSSEPSGEDVACSDTCFTYCPFGHVRGKDNCKTCVCKQDPCSNYTSCKSEEKCFARRSRGCQGDNCDPTPQCLLRCPRKCETSCDFGYVLDEEGCPSCFCRDDPCLNKVCLPGFICEAVKPPCAAGHFCDLEGICRFSATTTTTTAASIDGLVKESTTTPSELKCPTLLADFIGACMEECDTRDLESCPPGLMCCSNGCGHSCLTPVSTYGKTTTTTTASIDVAGKESTTTSAATTTTTTRSSIDEVVKETTKKKKVPTATLR